MTLRLMSFLSLFFIIRHFYYSKQNVAEGMSFDVFIILLNFNLYCTFDSESAEFSKEWFFLGDRGSVHSGQKERKLRTKLWEL